MTKIITNNHIRESIEYWQATDKQKKLIESAYGGLIDLTDDTEFVFYRNWPYFMGDCLRFNDPEFKSRWDGYFDDTAFSTILVKRVDDGYIFGIAYSE